MSGANDPAGGDLLPAALAERAQAMATDILLRLIDCERVIAATNGSRQAVEFPGWVEGASTYGGAAGIAMAFAHAARALEPPGPGVDGWRVHAGTWLREAAGGTHHRPVTSAGVADGTAGLTLVLDDLSAQDGRWAGALRTLHGNLCDQVDALERQPAGTLYFGVYDTIRGRAGILGSIAAASSPGPALRRCAHALVDHLVNLCAVRQDSDPWAPWRIPVENQPKRDSGRYPHGYVDLGLAHGIPGPLAALSRAWEAGYRRPGLRDAIRNLADRMVEAAQTDAAGPRWGRVLPYDETGAVAPHHGPVAGPTFCYGAPGICSALLDAADVLADGSLHALAVSGFEAALGPVRDGHDSLVFPGLCHGLAGLMLVCRKFAVRTGSEPARALLTALTEELIDRCDPAVPFLVQDYRPAYEEKPSGSSVAERTDGLWIDNPGMLEGAAGVALALMSIPSSVPPRWARALLVE